MEPADNFRNLLLVAASDGRMSESELRLLSHRAAEWGITDDQFESAIYDAIQGRAALTLPSAPSERIELLKDMIRMMAADGRMSENEKELFAIVSAALSIDTDTLNRIIDDVIEDAF